MRNALLVIFSLLFCEGMLRVLFPIGWHFDPELGWARDFPPMQDVVCIGDSFTERSDFCPGANYGVAGYSTVQELLLVRRIKPRHVVLQLYANDFAGNVTKTAWPDRERPVYGDYTVQQRDRVWYKRLRLHQLLFQTLFRLSDPEPDAVVARDILHAYVDSIRAEVESLTVVVIPARWEVQQGSLTVSGSLCRGCIMPALTDDDYDWTHHLSASGSRKVATAYRSYRDHHP